MSSLVICSYGINIPLSQVTKPKIKNSIPIKIVNSGECEHRIPIEIEQSIPV